MAPDLRAYLVPRPLVPDPYAVPVPDPGALAPDSLPMPAYVVPAPEEDFGPPWERGVVASLSAAQAAYSNWTEGGLNTLALTSGLDAKAEQTAGNGWRQTYRAHLELGFIQQDTFTVRKSSDVIRLASTLQYEGDGFFRTFSPTLAADVRTQFIAGYNYKRDPFDAGQEPPVKVSDILAPGTFTQTVGLTYSPQEWIEQRLSVGTKVVVVTERRLRTLYSVPPDKMARYEAGLESTTSVDREIAQDVRLRSSLGLFAAFNRPDMPDLSWENLLVMQFNEWLSVDLEFTTLYDRDVSAALQIRESLSVGASVAIL